MSDIEAWSYSNQQILDATLPTWRSPVYAHYNVSIERHTQSITNPDGSIDPDAPDYMDFKFICKTNPNHPAVYRRRVDTGRGTGNLISSMETCHKHALPPVHPNAPAEPLFDEKARQHRPGESNRLAEEQCAVWARIVTELRDKDKDFNRFWLSSQTRFDKMMLNCDAASCLEDRFGETTEEGQHIKESRKQHVTAAQTPPTSMPADQTVGQRLRLDALSGSVTWAEPSEEVQIEHQRKRPPPSSNPNSNSASTVQRKRARNSSEAESLNEASTTLEAEEETFDNELDITREEERERHCEITEGLRGIANAIDKLADVISRGRQDTRTLLKVIDKLVTRQDTD
ncbi:hypothetical protein FRC09_014374 [Ceratobasidium sp. 395]|nr:hypothetical protein FRC09_014374 [Ceratobasidium sp. 395]